MTQHQPIERPGQRIFEEVVEVTIPVRITVSLPESVEAKTGEILTIKGVKVNKFDVQKAIGEAGIDLVMMSPRNASMQWRNWISYAAIMPDKIKMWEAVKIQATWAQEIERRFYLSAKRWWQEGGGTKQFGDMRERN